MKVNYNHMNDPNTHFSREQIISNCTKFNTNFSIAKINSINKSFMKKNSLY